MAMITKVKKVRHETGQKKKRLKSRSCTSLRQLCDHDSVLIRADPVGTVDSYEPQSIDGLAWFGPVTR